MARVISLCNQKGGVGKCLAPETPVFLSNGELASIEEIFNSQADTGAAQVFEEEGTFFSPKNELKVFSLNDEFKIVESKVEALYRGRTEKLFEIKSNKGKTVRVTPRHPFLVLKDNRPEWIRTEELREGDFIAVPRQITVSNEDETDLTTYIPDRIYVQVNDKSFVSKHLADILSYSQLNLEDKVLFRILREKEVGALELYQISNRGAVFRHLNNFLEKGLVNRRRKSGREFVYSLNREKTVEYIHGRGFSIRILEKFNWPKDIVVKFLYHTRFSYSCNPINPIFKLDEDLARFVALILAEGYVGTARIIFYNSSPELVDFFTAYCERIGIPHQKKWIGTQWKVTVNKSGTLMKFLSDAFEVPTRGNRKSSRVRVPSLILRARQEILAAYLGAYISCEGYVARSRSTLEIASASFENIVRLQYAFLRFGINARVKGACRWATNSEKPKKRIYHSLFITGSPDIQIVLEYIPVMVADKLRRLKKACQFINNTNVDVVPAGEFIKTVRQKLGLFQRELGIQGTITDYEDGSYSPSRVALERIVSVIDKNPLFSTFEAEMGWFSQLASSHIYWERIDSITPVNYSGYVYDLTVSDTHNFIAGFGAFVVHNTTTAVNLGSYLAALGRRVLLVDFDPQANASSALGANPLRTEVSIYHGVINAVPPEHVLKPTMLFNFHFTPSAPHLAGALIEFVNLPEREYFLRKFLNRVRHSYDYVLIDLPPSLSLLTVNGLVASDEVMIPVQAEYYSLEGLGQLLETIELIRANLRHNLTVSGALLTMYNRGERLSREVARNLRKNFPHLVFKTEIPRSVALAEAPSFSKPIMLYRPDSIGAVAYRSLAEEVVAQERPFDALPEHGKVSDNFGNFNII